MEPLKISFLGDIMFEQQYVRACKEKNDHYDFSSLFKNTKQLISQSDYVVGNLETVCGGKEKKYSHEIYSFNSPDEVLDAIKQSGISMVTTANNHCLDRGKDGLFRTLEELDKRQIEHTGVFRDAQQENKFMIKEFNGKRIAFISYTYGTNFAENKIELSAEDVGHINLLKPQTTGKMLVENKKPAHPIKKGIVKILQTLISSDARMKLKKVLGMPLNVPITDMIADGDLDKTYLAALTTQLKRAKNMSDFVFLCVHTGGQFNDKPGEYTEYIMKFAVEHGADAIIGTHPHVVQKLDMIMGKPVFYSLGNFSFSPGSIYVLHELLPEYSIVPHFYFDTTTNPLQLKKITCSILKTVENREHLVSVHNVKDLLNRVQTTTEKEQLMKDVNFIYRRILNNDTVINNFDEEFELVTV